MKQEAVDNPFVSLKQLNQIAKTGATRPVILSNGVKLHVQPQNLLLAANLAGVSQTAIQTTEVSLQNTPSISIEIAIDPPSQSQANLKALNPHLVTVPVTTINTRHVKYISGNHNTSIAPSSAPSAHVSMINGDQLPAQILLAQNGTNKTVHVVKPKFYRQHQPAVKN